MQEKPRHPRIVTLAKHGASTGIPAIRVDAAVVEALGRLAIGTLFPNEVPTGDGDFYLPVDEDILARLEKIDPDPNEAVRKLLGMPTGVN